MRERFIGSIQSVSQFTADWKACWADFAWRWNSGFKRGLLFLLGWVALTWLLFGWFDEPLLLWIQGRSGADLNVKRVIAPNQEGLVAFCKWLRVYSDFLWFNFFGGLALLGYGFWKKKVHWRRAGLAFFLAGAMAGVTVQTLKTFSGRPRPSTLAKSEEAQTAYDFRGITFKGGWRGYPSGHSAAVWASCIALGLRFRKALVPLLIFASIVGWSRIYGNYHWPTDVLSGAALGTLIGWFWGAMRGEREVME